MLSSRTYPVTVGLDASCRAHDHFWVVPTELYHHRTCTGAPVGMRGLKISEMEVEIIKVVEESVRVEHLSVRQCRAIPPSEQAEGSVALVDHWGRNISQVRDHRRCLTQSFPGVRRRRENFI